MRETARWREPDDRTARTILLATREERTDATPAEIMAIVRYNIIEGRYDGWGGVVMAIREGWNERRRR